jgi:uncharacterized protein (DUF2141 family)
MVSKKIVPALFFIIFGAVNMFADNIHTVIEITGINVNGGSVHVGVFTNEQDHKRDRPFATFILESMDSTLAYELELPEGYCLISAYQDTNNNGKMDTGFFGIPKEPIALTNYSGSGIPGGFNKHKVPINRNTIKISVNLYPIRLYR